jgi:hypothetical protein
MISGALRNLQPLGSGRQISSKAWWGMASAGLSKNHQQKISDLPTKLYDS